MTAAGLLKALADASCAAYAVSLDQTIVFWNQAAERILGYSSQDVLGRRCYEVMAGRVAGNLTPQCLKGCPSIRYLRAGLVPARSQLHMLCASGEHKWISVTPMVVAGLLKDAPLLVHLLEESSEQGESEAGIDAVHETLAASGADIISERPHAPSSPPDAPHLTLRELDVLRLVALGWDTPRIAAELGISRHTVRNHIRNLRQKLRASTKLEAVVIGIRSGILPIGQEST